MPIDDGYLADKLKYELESEVSATIKLIMLEMERLASLPPEEAAEPVSLHRTRRAIIRKVWDLSKECIRYGARTIQRGKP